MKPSKYFVSLALLCIVAAPPARSQDAAPDEPPQPAKPRNRTGTRKLESTITKVETFEGAPRLTLREGALTLSLKPATELVREERDLTVAELKVGDMLSQISLKGRGNLKEPGRVASLAPLTIDLGETATLTLKQVENWSFDRVSPLTAADLVIGQTVALELSLLRDGGIEAKRVAVMIARSKPAPQKVRRKKATNGIETEKP